LISVGFSSASFAATAPSPVIEPIVVEQTKSSVKISWQVPSDGGSPITDYVIEMRTTSPSIPWRVFSDGINSNNEATITGLTRGVVYQFRVTATTSLEANYES
jgi:titin